MTVTNINPNPDLHKKIVEHIATLADSERITKATLSVLSRDVLEYLGVNKSTDINLVNRLIDVCTPMNKKVAAIFFAAFLPWKFDNENASFGEMFKNQNKREKRYTKIAEFLADPANDIWSWAATNIKIEEKPKNYADKIKTLVQRALADEKEGLDSIHVLRAVLAGGITVADCLDVLNEVADAVDGVVEIKTPQAMAANG